jgi:hypothetical protein
MINIEYINFSNFMKSEIRKTVKNKHFNEEDEKLFRSYYKKIERNQITGNQAVEDYFILQNNSHKKSKKCNTKPLIYMFVCFCFPCAAIYSEGVGKSV